VAYEQNAINNSRGKTKWLLKESKVPIAAKSTCFHELQHCRTVRHKRSVAASNVGI